MGVSLGFPGTQKVGCIPHDNPFIRIKYKKSCQEQKLTGSVWVNQPKPGGLRVPDLVCHAMPGDYAKLKKSELLNIIEKLEDENALLKAMVDGVQEDRTVAEAEEAEQTNSNVSMDEFMNILEDGIVWPHPGKEFWNDIPRNRPCQLAHDMQDLGTDTGSKLGRDGRSLHITHITAEMAPIAKVGGLGDVVTGLSAASIRSGHTVEILLPFYECIDVSGIEDLCLEKKYDSPTGKVEGETMYHSTLYFEAWRGKIEGCPVVLLRPDWDATGSNMFRGGAIYGGSYNETQAYLTFCRASLEYLAQTGIQPDIIHAHEWQAAAVPMLFWELYSSRMPNAKPILTIHNMDNSGECRQDEFAATGIDGCAYATVDRALDERTIGHNPERLCLLKGGIVYSSAVTTVSPTYAKETLEGGSAGWLQSTLARPEISAKYMGILNGIDTNVWNPAVDAYLPACFSSYLPEGKSLCKKYLQRGLGMSEDPGKPLVAVISRLVPQKGIHLIERAIVKTAESSGQFVLLGTGHASGGLQRMADNEYANNKDIAMLFMYSDPLSHLIYAAADMFLVPSMFEPCGLTQMIALRYGCVPIVRSTGGLADTIRDVEMSDLQQDDNTYLNPENGNGFVFHGVDARSLDAAMDRAFEMYNSEPDKWMALSLGNMEESSRWSWDGAAASYEQLYSGVIDQ